MLSATFVALAGPSMGDVRRTQPEDVTFRAEPRCAGMTSRRLRQLALAGSALVLATAAPTLASTSGTTSWTLPAVVPAFAHGVAAAAEPATAPVHLAVQLRGRNSTELSRFARAVSTPGSASYRRFLTHSQ